MTICVVSNCRVASDVHMWTDGAVVANDNVIVNNIIPIQQEVAKQYGLQVIDLHTLFANDSDKILDDGIHPDEKGARRMAEIIAGVLKQDKQ